MRLAIALAAALFADPAAAGGGLWCEADDGKVKIEIRSGMSHVAGLPLMAFGATIRIDDEAVPEDLREVDFGYPKQYWHAGDSLNLMLLRERHGAGPHGYVQATIITSYNPDSQDDEFEGEFNVTVADAGVFGPSGGAGLHRQDLVLPGVRLSRRRR